MYEFGVLGPLRVLVNGKVLPIGPRKHRILLATLLLAANRPVPIGDLIDRLWPESPPSGARRTVQAYVMRLRKELGPAGALVRSRPEAYAIEVSSAWFDLGRFTELTSAAGAARADGDPVAARDSLRAALAEWRGAPLSDIPSAAIAGAEVSRLTELWHRALEQRLELDIALDASGEAVGELRALVAENPLRERFWALLMRGLCQESRYAEAVAAYHEADVVLGAELGVRPGEELRELHALALSGGPARPGPHADMNRVRSLLAEALVILTGGSSVAPG